jgi:membrane protein
VRVTGVGVIRSAAKLIGRTFVNWRRHNGPALAAGMAYFSAISLVPLLILIIAGAGAVLGRSKAEGVVAHLLSGFLDKNIARAIEGFLRNAHRSGMGRTSMYSVLFLVWAAHLAFNHLQKSLHIIWRTDEDHRGVRAALRNRLLSVWMMFAVGLLMVVFLLGSVLLSSLGRWLDPLLPVHQALSFWHALGWVFLFALLSLVVALTFKWLPSAGLTWGDAWVGSLVTSILLSAGVSVVSAYLGRVHLKDVYGAASSLMAVLIWVYASAQVFFLGAEFTWVYAHTHGGWSVSGVDGRN